MTHFSFIPVYDQASDVDVVSRGCIPVTSQGGCHGEGEVSWAPPQCVQPPVGCGWYAHPRCCGKWQPLQQLWQREFWHHYLKKSAAIWLTCLVRRERFPVSKSVCCLHPFGWHAFSKEMGFLCPTFNTLGQQTMTMQVQASLTAKICNPMVFKRDGFPVSKFCLIFSWSPAPATVKLGLWTPLGMLLIIIE